MKQQVISSAIIRDTVYLDQKIFNEELASPTIGKQKIMAGRQHYLRFKVPDTRRLWDQASMEWKAPSDMPIFPDLGVAPAIPTPSLIASRKKMKVKEEAVDLNGCYADLLPAQLGRRRLASAQNEDIKHGGEWVTLVHNDLVKHPALKGLEELFYG
ncbi:MAG: hypothetical protein IPF93_22565 [Saprospiraceae bacterium]|nr:hypothetical protein [Saprospiraceae bacterium]